MGNNINMKKYFFLIILIILNTKLNAEIITDGTIGQRSHLTGPKFKINEQLGMQVGSNLFHSFQTFNIETGETAIFRGSSSVTNILARVTGNQSSWIDGKIISDANLYLLNPNGIVFGENASLDVKGSFHASTADYLRLGNTGKFSASQPQESVLTVAAPEAFGFLTAPSSIRIEGSMMIVPEENTLSIIGGDLFISDSILFAKSGKINLASVASSGEVIPTSSDLRIESLDLGKIHLGQINLSQSSIDQLKNRSKPNSEGNYQANIDVTDKNFINEDSGNNRGAGQIFIRAGKFISDKAWIFADTHGNEDGLGIDIFIDGDINLINGARITADNKGTGQGGNTKIQANNLTLSGRNLNICDETCKTKYLDFEKLTSIEKRKIIEEIVVFNKLPKHQKQEFIQKKTISEQKEFIKNYQDYISFNKYIDSRTTVASNTLNEGNGGNITINASSVEMQSGIMQAATENSGIAGNIHLEIDNLTLNNNSFITSDTKNDGKAGNITINANENIFLLNRGYISALSGDSGDAGSINITTNNALFYNDSGITTQSENTNGGNITFTIKNNLDLSKNSAIVAKAKGDAGNITITTKTASFSNTSGITTQSFNTSGGNITFTVTDRLDLSGDSRITAEAKNDAGDINIIEPEFFIFNNSKLLANANFGDGGNIIIEADHFIQSSNSIIDNSSIHAMNGEIEINAQQYELKNNFSILPRKFLTSSVEYTKKSCVGRYKNPDVARLAILGYQILPESPYSLGVHIPEELFATSTNDYSNAQLPRSEFLPEPSGCPSAP
jgi:filamentous hemagglutinin family protein